MKRLFRILFAAAFLVCIGSVAALTGYCLMQRQGSREYQDLIGRAVSMKQSAGQTGADSKGQSGEKTGENCVQAGDLKNPPLLLVDFEELSGMNGDTAAWIDFPGQAISYPVVHGGDNSHYLKYTFEGTRNSNGCIFADARNTGLMTDDNTIIYGHNMRNGSMFGLLKRYMEQDHYEQYPYFDIYTPEAVYRCEIIACCRIRAQGENYPIKFSSDPGRTQFVQDMKKQAQYSIELPEAVEGEPVDIGHSSTDSPLVMLSTCVGGQRRYRFVVLARAVEVIE